MSNAAFRFGGIARLYGKPALERLQKSHAMVIGVGGVGSWTVEALARTGVGRITLVDLDEVCVSNINRQSPAFDSTVGQAKVEIMARRIQDINPQCQVDVRLQFFTADTANELLGGEDSTGSIDVVIDAIDAVGNKVLLIHECHRRKLPLVVCGGAGGRRDPTQVRVSDLSQVTHDRLLSEVRKRLRQEHGFPRENKKFKIPAVHSAEPPFIPAKEETECAIADAPAPSMEGMRLNCDWGYGSATFVTGTFGFAAAAQAVALILAHPA
ncbi:MAG TPA: tRNA threonylcarbamoyladenosine dehydratase [Candidatus Limnocylindria bacterium]|jgi:tRNA A37 threonylcarbamoyladenosine dehydratase|nr:tRNA threonylcarbamoyladenosine dehydratase [Candidatus Limnocylindria bacterium]